jgi:D-inositol-3-phosphate glycosyltransferase
MVALEAMACGTPVIASEVGGLAFLIKDQKTGFTIPVDEPDALAECITKLLENPELRHQMGAEAANFALDYGWEKIATKMKLLYKKMISNSV